MLHDAAAGMLFLHSRRYVHGDLRSPNLFVTENGRVSAVGDINCAQQILLSCMLVLFWSSGFVLTSCSPDETVPISADWHQEDFCWWQLLLLLLWCR
jgi:serine/threonine protein kinase